MFAHGFAAIESDSDAEQPRDAAGGVSAAHDDTPRQHRRARPHRRRRPPTRRPPRAGRPRRCRDVGVVRGQHHAAPGPQSGRATASDHGWARSAGASGRGSASHPAAAAASAWRRVCAERLPDTASTGPAAGRRRRRRLAPEPGSAAAIAWLSPPEPIANTGAGEARQRGADGQKIGIVARVEHEARRPRSRAAARDAASGDRVCREGECRRSRGRSGARGAAPGRTRSSASIGCVDIVG